MFSWFRHWIQNCRLTYLQGWRRNSPKSQSSPPGPTGCERVVSHQHILGYSVPDDSAEDVIKEWRYNQDYILFSYKTKTSTTVKSKSENGVERGKGLSHKPSNQLPLLSATDPLLLHPRYNITVTWPELNYTARVWTTFPESDSLHETAKSSTCNISIASSTLQARSSLKLTKISKFCTNFKQVFIALSYFVLTANQMLILQHQDNSRSETPCSINHVSDLVIES